MQPLLDRPTENPALAAADARAAVAEAIRQQFDIDDVFAEFCAIVCELRGPAHPLYQLAQHCITIGTTAETGQRPSMNEFVGGRLEPWLQTAIENVLARAMGKD
jgi:hypothetical protein